MTITTISSATREVHMGFDQRSVIIGERINPTGRKILAEEMKNGDYSRVESDALAQVAAGAHAASPAAVAVRVRAASAALRRVLPRLRVDGAVAVLWPRRRQRRALLG